MAAAVTSPIQKIVTPRHRNSVRKNGPNSAVSSINSSSNGSDKKHSKSRESTSVQVPFIFCILSTYFFTMSINRLLITLVAMQAMHLRKQEFEWQLRYVPKFQKSFTDGR